MFLLNYSFFYDTKNWIILIIMSFIAALTCLITHPITFIQKYFLGFTSLIFPINFIINISFYKELNNYDLMLLSCIITLIVVFFVTFKFLYIWVRFLYIIIISTCLIALISIYIGLQLNLIGFTIFGAAIIIYWIAFASQLIIISYKNKNSWYIKIKLFPEFYFLTMKSLPKSDRPTADKINPAHCEKQHEKSKNIIENYIKNLKNGLYIADTNFIITKKLENNNSIKILYDIPCLNIIGRYKFKKSLKSVYGKYCNKCDRDFNDCKLSYKNKNINNLTRCFKTLIFRKI